MNEVAVITVRYDDGNEESPSWGCVMERSFRTPAKAMAYRELLDSHHIYNHWIVLETVSADLIGTWDGKSL